MAARTAHLDDRLDLPPSQSQREHEDERGGRQGCAGDQADRGHDVALDREDRGEQLFHHSGGGDHLDRVVAALVAPPEQGARFVVPGNGDDRGDRVARGVAVEVERRGVLGGDLVVFDQRGVGLYASAVASEHGGLGFGGGQVPVPV